MSITLYGKNIPIKRKKLKLRNENIHSIYDIEGLEGVGYITSLDLSNNNITKIEGLAHLMDLKRLNLQGNYIKEIQGLDTLQELTHLNLSKNPIEKMKGFNYLTELYDLNLNKTKIEVCNGLQYNQKLNILRMPKNIYIPHGYGFNKQSYYTLTRKKTQRWIQYCKDKAAGILPKFKIFEDQ